MGKTEEEWKVINRKLVRNYLDGYRAGQLAMRERAAVGLEEMGCSCHLASTPKGHCPHELALEIRALAPEEPT